MSYSRWSNSRFYTYWGMDGLFHVDCEHAFTPEQIRDDIEKCLDIANGPTDNPLNVGYGVPLETTREELRGYMLEFLNDPMRLEHGKKFSSGEIE